MSTDSMFDVVFGNLESLKRKGIWKMCDNFECIHQQYGICNFDDEECEGESCINWEDCGNCAYDGTGCSTEYGEDGES